MSDGFLDEREERAEYGGRLVAPSMVPSAIKSSGQQLWLQSSGRSSLRLDWVSLETPSMPCIGYLKLRERQRDSLYVVPKTCWV